MMHWDGRFFIRWICRVHKVSDVSAKEGVYIVLMADFSQTVVHFKRREQLG